jgi:hypothetical protein
MEFEKLLVSFDMVLKSSSSSYMLYPTSLRVEKNFFDSSIDSFESPFDVDKLPSHPINKKK